MNPMARRMFDLVEPIGSIPYWADEPHEAMCALGYSDPWDTYFAGRAAPLGPVSAEVVDALFYNFAPGEVARHIPRVWDVAAPDAVFAAREAGCVQVLRRVLGADVDTPDFARAADLLALAAEAGCIEGRPMYAALRAGAIPSEPAARLFHAASLLREHRGDGHIAALMIEGIGRTESHVLFTLGTGTPAAAFGRTHHLPARLLADVIGGLRDRGLVGADGWLTDTGRAVRQRVEDLTDDLAAPPYHALTAAELDELTGLLEPFAARLLAVRPW